MSDEEEPLRVEPLGPCHALGGAGHRCNTKVELVRVKFSSSKRDGLTVRWCEAAKVEARLLADECGEECLITKIHLCPDCGVSLDVMLFMGVQPDGFVCPDQRTYYAVAPNGGPESTPTARVI